MQPIATYRTARGRLALVAQAAAHRYTTESTWVVWGQKHYTLDDIKQTIGPEAARTLRVFYRACTCTPDGATTEKRFGPLELNEHGQLARQFAWRRRPAGA